MSASTAVAGATVPPPAETLTPGLEPATRDFVARSLAEQSGDAGTVMIAVPAPVTAPEMLFAAAGRELAFLWDPPGEKSFAGVGAVHRVDLAGEERFADLERRASEIFADFAVLAAPGVAAPGVAAPGVVAPRPRLFGGFAFAVGTASQEPWSELGDGCFTLPRLLYARRGPRAVLALAARRRELQSASRRDALLMELESAVAELERERPPFADPPRLISVEPSSQGFNEEIEAIRAAIAAGTFEKIVAARRSRVEFAAPLDLISVLGRLSQGLLASTRFAFCRERSTFLGATPERLVALDGRRVECEALAGSIAAGAERASQLLDSGKDRGEHRLVVEAIVRRLEPLCESFQAASQPRVRELREVLHLHTPISGVLARPRHVLELVERLHPTPAVGWLDGRGGGEFSVALRSCVMAGHEAFLYAGAGIVRDSDPELEYKEIELKKKALLEALGATK